FGRWEGYTIPEMAQKEPEAVAARERDKWRFVPPGGESYEQMSDRMGDWYSTLEDDAIVVAHGGTARALIVWLGIAPPSTAPMMDIGQGVVYCFRDGGMVCYA